ncbi:hypothetical protein ALC62_00288 [Cyphomyrmex costatus]|uniref:Uncharacterized protein n=1 Tax=Cyphomyrmex costatus TaxID=456900 RepID=A0A195D6W7_9HYME|nr:hypothetical protein ALC62_00288 [Cyphomyrmex costatus]
MAWYTRSWKKSEDGVRTAARGGGGIGGKYYDSKQQETVMDRRERAHGPRAAFPLYKSPPVLSVWQSPNNHLKILHYPCQINALKSKYGDSMYHKRERERSAIGLETAALIDATYTCEGNSGDSAVFEYAGEKRKRK